MHNNTPLPDFHEHDLEIQPLERSETIPSAWYTDPRVYDFEREAIFTRTWQGVGHLSKLQQAGDQIVVCVADNPILAVRGQDSVLRAFYNVCRHRGGPLATVDCSSKMLQCKYHGWTYQLDGSLRGTPKFDRTELFDKKDFGLVPVSVDNWEGLVFVNLSTDGLPLPSLVKGIKERIAPISFSSKQFARRVVYQVDSNWKVYVDNFLEGYHLPYVHPELCNLLDYQNYRTETFEYYSLQHSPLQPGENFYGDSDGPAYYYYLWPNFMLNILPGRLQTNLVLPAGHNRCTVQFDYYYDDVVSDKALKLIQGDLEYSEKIQQEDMEICGHVQKGLESRAYTSGRFSPEMENGVYHFQSLLKRAYQQALQQ